MTQYERELSTHYAQVRKRLLAVPLSKPIIIHRPQIEPKKEIEPITKIEREPVENFYRLAFERWTANNVKESKFKPMIGDKMTYKRILAEVVKETGLTAEQIVGRSRQKHLIQARRYFWWRCARGLQHMSMADIGRRSGHDHTTVLHAIAAYRRDYEGIEQPKSRKGRLLSDSSWRVQKAGVE